MHTAGFVAMYASSDQHRWLVVLPFARFYHKQRVIFACNVLVREFSILVHNKVTITGFNFHEYIVTVRALSLLFSQPLAFFFRLPRLPQRSNWIWVIHAYHLKFCQ